MTASNDDLRILAIRELSTPAEVMREIACTPSATATVAGGRRAFQDILHGRDDRLVVVIGPCSIHDPQAALDYAERLAAERSRLSGQLEIVMRVYFEKPRTTVGWKGLINDPGLDDSFDIDRGLRLARGLLRDVAAMGVPAACEFLDMTTPQYIADLVTWAAIGARTTESQVHRELASGLSCPVGFKNGTDGNVRIATEAVMSASRPHHFLAVTKEGRSAIASTAGNEDCHIILRGGRMPNYDAESVEAACAEAVRAGIPPRVMIDASHANSGKKPENQPLVVDDVARQVGDGEDRVFGVMIESNLVGGRQDHMPGRPLVYGQSITDGCLDWARSVEVLEALASAVDLRRRRLGAGERQVRPSAMAV